MKSHSCQRKEAQLAELSAVLWDLSGSVKLCTAIPVSTILYGPGKAAFTRQSVTEATLVNTVAEKCHKIEGDERGTGKLGK